MKKVLSRILLAVSGIFIYVLLSSCSSDTSLYKTPEFESTGTGEFEVISDDLYFRNATDLFIYGQYAIIVGYNEDCYLHIYNKDNGKLLKRTIRKGRGPYELAQNPLFVEFDSTSGILAIHNRGKGVKITCSIEDIVNDEPDAIYEEFSNISNFAEHCFTIADNNTLYMYNYSPVANDTSNFCRFRIDDVRGEILCKYTEYPYPYVENSFLRWNFYNPGNYSLSYSPDKEKFAIGISRGAILETFSVSDNHIIPLSVSHFIDPELNETSEELNYILGFIDLCATDEYLYAIYDGANYIIGPSFYDRGQNLVQFDWKGKPLKKINMGVRMERIYIDNDTNTLYALIYRDDKECALAKYRIN